MYESLSDLINNQGELGGMISPSSASTGVSPQRKRRADSVPLESPMMRHSEKPSWLSPFALSMTLIFSLGLIFGVSTIIYSSSSQSTSSSVSSTSSSSSPFSSSTPMQVSGSSGATTTTTITDVPIFTTDNFGDDGELEVEFEPIMTKDEWLLTVNGDDGTSTKPNIIFILADDLGWNSMGYKDYDLSFATPFMSELASSGIIMDSYYSQELCTPARAALLTGRYPVSIGMQYSSISGADAVGLSLEETLMPEVLSDNGYSTVAIGKWDIGMFGPEYLPTARGFDSYTGYLGAQIYYFSKKLPGAETFVDFITSNRTCYEPYTQSDLHEYSTYLFRDLAITTIQEHDTSIPLFMYLSFQAVHNPWIDDGYYQKGVPKEYLSDEVYDLIHNSGEVVGHERRQYAMALNILDGAVESIYNALIDKGMMNNTYIIFASDNGGCFSTGGKNGPLRGTKATLFEGGTRVDSFIYSPLLASQLQGTIYSKMMHVTDWFPTINELAGIEYTAPDGYELEGVSAVSGWFGESEPRDEMLYNFYTNVASKSFNMWTNGTVAIRTSQYKLIHFYNSSSYATWYDASTLQATDDIVNEGGCNIASSMNGEFVYAMYDLINDPYETTNLSDSEDEDVIEAKAYLYERLAYYEGVSQYVSQAKTSEIAYKVWQKHGNYVVPWKKASDVSSSSSFPVDCTVITPSSSPTLSPVVSPVDDNVGGGDDDGDDGDDGEVDDNHDDKDHNNDDADDKKDKKKKKKEKEEKEKQKKHHAKSSLRSRP